MDQTVKVRIVADASDAIAKTGLVEQSFKTLGIKSAGAFNEMRNDALRAFKSIQYSAMSTANDIIRAETAKNATLKRLNEQQYGHQATLYEGLKSHWMGLTAAIGAAAIVANKAWDLAKVGAEYAEQKGILDNLTNKYKTTADSMVASMQQASEGLIAKSDLMQVALSGISKGLKPEQLTNLADAAKILGDAVGKNATTALQDLTQALETGRARGLKTYTGSTISLADAFGDLESKLTDVEKAQAMYNLTMIHAAELQGQQAKAVDETADTMERMEADYNNARLAAGGFFKEVIAYAFRATKAITDYYIVWHKLKAGDYSSIFPDKSPKATKQGDKFNVDGDLSTAQLAELDMELLRRDLAKRGTAGKIGGGKTDNAAKEAERIAREAAKAAEAAHKEAAENIARNYEQAVNEMLDEINTGMEATLKSIKAGEEALAAALEAAKERLNFNEFSKDQSNVLLTQYEQDIAYILDAETKKFKYLENLEAKGVITHAEAEEEKRKATEKRIKSEKELISERFMNENDELQGIAQNTSAMFSTFASLYKEDSRERQALSTASKAATIAEIALQAQKNLMIAVGAVVQQGTGDPYTAFARIAAMISVVTSVLSVVGLAFGGGSSSGGSSHSAASTVLGAENGTGSESVSKSFELLSDIYDIENTKLTNIYNELKNLNSNITGLVTSIVRTGGVSAEGMGINLSTGGLSMKPWEKDNARKLWESQNDIGSQGGVGLAASFLTSGVSQTPLLQKITNWMGSLGENIFGGGIDKSIAATGLSFNNQNISSILSGGLNAQQYADIKTTKSGGWFGSDKTSTSTQYQALNSDVSSMFNQVFQGLGNTLVAFAPELGKSMSDVLNYTFEQTTLNLQDMSTEEMTTAINEYISNASDKAVEALFGDVIGKYQKLNEGLMETATRLVIDKEIVASIMEDTGKSLTGTVPEMIAFSEQLIEIAGSLDALSEAAESYIDKFYTDAEKYASIKETISDVAGILPKSRESYRALVDSIDMTSESGKMAKVTLWNLSEIADSYYSHIEEIASQRAEMDIQLLEAQGKAAEALAASRQRELDAMDESLRPLQELIWLTHDLGTSLETITSQTSTAINELISNSSSAASQARSAAQTYKGLIDTFSEAQIKIFGGGKAGAQTRLNDIYKTAMTGDADALGKMPAAIDTLLSESLRSASTSLEYRRDQAKSYIALENAKKVSEAMVNWNEYHATLLETQVKTLEEMRDILAGENPSLLELQKHAELLGNIATLLSAQTVQVVAGNTYVQDQTGKIISQSSIIGAGNELTTKQTAQVITGNAVQDVIKNIDALNTSYTAEMLTALVNGGSGQQNSLLSILSSSQTVVSLLGRLVSMTEANAQAVKSKEIEMSKGQYASAVAESTSAWNSYLQTHAEKEAAYTRATYTATEYNNAQHVAAVTGQIYANNPTEANAAELNKYLAIATAKYGEYSTAAATYNAAIAKEKVASDYYYQTIATADKLKAVTNALIAVYNAQYPAAQIPGLATGGYVMVGENGPELAQFGSSARVYSNKDSKSLVDVSELTAEVKGLRADIKTMSRSLNSNSQKQVSLLNTFNETGMLTRAAS